MSFAVKIKPGSRVNLSDIPSTADGGMKKDEGEALADKLGKELGELQELLYAAGDTPLLIVLQGRDTAGKDGAIRFLLRYLNAQSTSVASFKVPSSKEMAHDYLWRVHQVVPGKGEVVIFNRSHYEDVLVVRVHELVKEAVWSKRYGHINDFEKMLSDTGTRIVKFMLHISPEEQEKRLLEREEDVTKSWKLSVGDWKERTYWDAYTKAYEDVLERCSTEVAPWHVIQSDKKWYRNLAIAEVLRDTLKEYKEEWMKDLEETGAKAKADLAAFRSGQV